MGKCKTKYCNRCKKSHPIAAFGRFAFSGKIKTNSMLSNKRNTTDAERARATKNSPKSNAKFNKINSKKPDHIRRVRFYQAKAKVKELDFTPITKPHIATLVQNRKNLKAFVDKDKELKVFA